jgi:hypothetical protein
MQCLFGHEALFRRERPRCICFCRHDTEPESAESAKQRDQQIKLSLTGLYGRLLRPFRGSNSGYSIQ